MKKILVLVLVLVISNCDTKKKDLSTKKILTESLIKKPQIGIIGTFHFANTTDYSAIVIEDLNSKKRQKELSEIINGLAEFNPTKILIERDPSLNDSLSKKLIEFKKNQYKLPNNELYQIGFRLAKKLDLDKIYGVDYHIGLGDEELVAFLNKEELMEKFSEIIASSKVWAKEHTTFLEKHTIGEVLEKINKTESEKFNRNLYIDGILNITKNGNSTASDYVSNWYKRNIYIKKNIDDLINTDDRILLIIGAGHSSILKDFYRSSENVEYIELKNLLKK